eukprot:g18082.t1
MVNAFQATRKAAGFAASAVVEGVATGIIEIGAITPVVAPLCVALLKAKGVVDGASRNQEELKDLLERCDLITVQVIDKAKFSSNISTAYVSPLVECVAKLNEVAQRYNNKSRLAKLRRFRKDGEDIQKLRASIEAVVPIMGLAVVVNNRDKLDQILVSLQPSPKLAPVPKNVPITKSSHVVRDGVEEGVCRILGGCEPAMAALTGRSGAGKTSAAAAMVGERQGPVHRRENETEDQARTRLNRLRALFPDGVVWLRVGKGEGAADRLPPLMLRLAKSFHEEVMARCVHGPEVGEDGENYVKRIVEQKSMRCLVVADDVWENEVVDKLRKTGMWVLLTTRTASIIRTQTNVVVVDKLTIPEAEHVLRAAAELPRRERLCDDAIEVLELCKFVAMDIAFIGSWTCVCTANGVPKSNKAWARVVEEIEAEAEHVRGQMQVRNAGGMNDLDINRLAVLRAGFMYLGMQDPLAQQLYVALALVPDGHSFGRVDAAVLLGDEEATMGSMSILERWGVIREDNSGLFRVHDAHVLFARDKLMGWEDVRKSAVARWTFHVSRLDFAVSIDVHTLLHIWRVLEHTGGKGWFESRPYDSQLAEVNAAELSTILAVHMVAELYDHDLKFRELETIMKQMSERCDDHGENGCPEVKMAALHYIRISLWWQGRVKEMEDVGRQLGEMTRPDIEFQLPNDNTGFLQMATTLCMYGACAQAAKRYHDAEGWFRKALKAHDHCGGTGSYQTCWAMIELGHCVLKDGRPVEAEGWFARALKIQEDQWGPDHLKVAWTLYDIGRCVYQAGRTGEAEKLLRRALEIEEGNLGTDHPGVAMTLHHLGVCVREVGRPEEAEGLFVRALEIKETHLGDDDPEVARTLQELARCVRESGRPVDAEERLRLAREINDAI